jgi:hypothetical protein
MNWPRNIEEGTIVCLAPRNEQTSGVVGVSDRKEF